MARMGWDALSPNYRKTLEKGGITKAAYERGESLSEARRHGKTPEHPHQFDEQKYPDYARERERLTRELEKKKQQLFGGTPTRDKGRVGWDAERSSENIREKPPSMAKLRWALAADESELIDALREDPTAYKFLGYH